MRKYEELQRILLFWGGEGEELVFQEKKSLSCAEIHPPSLLRHVSTAATSPYKNEQYAQDTTFVLPLSSWEKEVSEGKSPFLLSPPFLAARRPSKGKARK